MVGAATGVLALMLGQIDRQLQDDAAWAVTSEEKKAEARAAREKLDEWQKKLNEASDNYYDAMDAHDAAVKKVQEAQDRIDAAQEKLLSLQDRLSDRARSMYRTGSATFLDVLMSAESFEEFVSTWDTLNDLNEDDEHLVSETKQVKRDAEDAKKLREEQEQLAQDKLDEAAEIKAEAEQTVKDYRALIKKLDREVRRLVQQEREEAARRAAEEAAAAAASSGSYESSTPIPAKGSVVDYARSRLGCPYVWGATGPNTFDCSGLTSWCYRQAGITIPRTSSGQYAGAKARLAVSAAQPGDVLWHSGHVGICIKAGGGTYIAAPHTGDVVKVQTYPQWTCALRF